MKRFRIVFVVLLIVLCCFQIPQVQAAEIEAFYKSQDMEVATAGEKLEYSFDVDADCDTRFVIVAMNQSDIQMVISNASDEVLAETTLLENSGNFEESLAMYAYSCEVKLRQGEKYKLHLTFVKDNKFTMVIGRTVVREMQSVTVTKGFFTQLDTDRYEVESWECSDTTIATVENGKVVGKKKGKTTITAVIRDNLKLTWKVDVLDNVYTEKQINVSSKEEKKRYIQVYKAYYSGKKLILKVRIVNNTKESYSELRNLKLVVKTANGKTVGTYKASKKKVRIPKRSAKNLTFTISKPAIKNADLRLAKLSIKGTLFRYK